jgi:predicted RNA-binding protein with PUA-like domain
MSDEKSRYWLMKSEPESYSIDDLKRVGSTAWDGVRNYQARNFMRDQMKVGDPVLFYHSSAEPPGVAGIAKVCREAYADKKDPTWVLVDIEFAEKFPRLVSLEDLRKEPRLKTMLVLKRGQRLSIQPIEKEHFEIVKKMGGR